ncbi:MAG: hypothetical protein HQ546_01815 [Planctomycetes bacterium]|nr:hypothetical protein [Planctomycetota bacterium]
MAYKVYHNPTNVTIGSIFYGVVSISVSETFGEIHAAADDETHESVARYTTGRTNGTITFVDPTEAERASGTIGTLTFTLTDVKGAADKTVTIANCSLGGWDATVSRDAASSATVPFIAEAAPAIS